MSDGWFAVNLTFRPHEPAGALPGDVLARIAPLALTLTRGRNGSVYDVELPSTAGAEGLDAALAATITYLGDHLGLLQELLPLGAFSLDVGWTPRNPQDGIVLSGRALATLAALSAQLYLDTYADD